MDLSLVETHELTRELAKRFDHIAIVGMRAGCKGPDTHQYVRCWDGNTHTCMGLCDDLKARIFDEFKSYEIIDRTEE